MHKSLQNKIDVETFTEEIGFGLGLNNGRFYIRTKLPDKNSGSPVQCELQINNK